ncbi:MAG TPA: BTAD domain-containing putative transcriptional regulator [Actinophytocola sp.]|uniref:AfsR/SARP family transcriptional regulator n=1 Tax=Actinophytocola sp. TaxID=1872138 RepID=UPI002DB78115|nr:BTAD domain-containing putative transcriptional regulator [Actinophytocola sp.]HEU5472906.1 BTAD domain-containing putative transcriptional regulator [Actinophytocola sp.]
MDVARSTDGVQFKILGPIEVTSAEAPVRIPPGRQPVILGALLLEPNRVVSIDRLIDVVWDEKPPATARTQVQICVSALRQTFAGLGVDQPIETRAPGYLLRVADGQLDSQLFSRLLAEAAAAEREGLVEDAVVLLRKAVALWRGPALGGATGSVLGSAAVRLEEAKLTALETCIDLELRLGRHHLLIGELGSLVSEQPLRERLRGQLMLALYRSGRPAEALEVYRAGWRIMVDELGLEPGEELRNLEALILAEDHSLQVEAQDSPAHLQVRSPAGPHQLPADIVDFTGREELVAAAEAALLDGADPADRSPAMRVVLITGKAGIGKSALAVHVAHRLAQRRFLDGQLYCNLAGAHHEPVSAADALGRFLRALGILGSAIPDGLDERAEMYRSLMAGRQMLVVLDDVAAVREVMPLLPGSGSCAVIVTSRMRLTEIPGARLLDVGLLAADKAMELLGNVVGAQRVGNESTAAMALVRMVGGLPLALRIVAARLAARPHWSLASMVGRLADERRRLDELTHGDLMVRASLRLTYEGLEPRDALLFRMLGALTEGSFPTWAAAALLDDEPAVVAAQLERLVDMQLLDVIGPDLDGEPRYGLHAIIRLFAREELAERESTAVRAEAVERVLGGWLANAERARAELYGTEHTVLSGSARRWYPPGDAGVSAGASMRWLEAECVNLVAAVKQAADEGLAELAWDLAICLVTLFEVGGYGNEWELTHERALEAVRLAGNKRGEAAVLCSLSSLYLFRRRPAEALAMLEPALRQFEELGDVLGLATVRRNMAVGYKLQGDIDSAATNYTAAFDGFGELGDTVGQAYVLSRLGQISSERGDYQRATDQFGEALAMCRDAGSRRVEAQVLFRLGDNLMRQRRFEEADLVLGTVLDLVRDLDDLMGEGMVLHTLGLVRVRLGRRAEARQLMLAAIGVRERIMDHVGAARVRLDLAPLLADQGDQAGAIELAEHAASLFGQRRAAELESEARRLLATLTDSKLAR